MLVSMEESRASRSKNSPTAGCGAGCLVPVGLYFLSIPLVSVWRILEATGLPPSPTDLAVAAATVCAMLVLMRVATRRLEPTHPGLAAGMVGGATALWLLPILLGLPDSPASGGMVFFIVGAIGGASYIATRLAANPRHAFGRSATRPLVAPTLALALASVLSLCCEGMPRPTLWPRDWEISSLSRVLSIVAAAAMVGLVLFLRERERAHRERVLAAQEATNDESGRVTLPDGSRIEVGGDLPPGPVLVMSGPTSPSYRDNRTSAPALCIVGTREQHADTSERRLHALDVHAVTSALCIAAPASADLSRAMIEALGT